MLEFLITIIIMIMIIYVSVFFSLPVGAELPIYYTHKQGKLHIISISCIRNDCLFFE